MNVALQCQRCGREMHSSGIRGMCPQCLFACATSQFDKSASVSVAPEDEEILACDVAVGPNGRFLLLDKLGEGGMGEVWLADDRALSQGGEAQFVALKFLSHSIRSNAAAVAAIRSEVLRSQRLTHPHIVRVFDLHTTRSGLPFIKMEYVEGNSLSHWLRNRPGRVMPWQFVTQLTRQLAGALLHAHENVGIVHRDLKPANLLLAQGSFIKLSDFGLSQAIRQGARTANELVGGTLAYAGPQQLAGAPPMPADDVYALGATLYELLTGEPPFEAETSEALINKIICDQPEPIPDRLRRLGRTNKVPSKLLVLVQRCLEKDPNYRPKTNEITRLLPLTAEAPPTVQISPTQDPSAWEINSKSPGRIANWFWTIASILAICGAIAWWWDIGQTRRRVEEGGKYVLNLVGLGPALPAAEPLPTNAPPEKPTDTLSNTNQLIPEAEKSGSNAKPIAPPATKGTLNLVVNAAKDFPYYRFVITDVSRGSQWTWRPPQRGKSLLVTTNLPEGDYTVSVSAGGTEKSHDDPGWNVTKPAEILRGATNNLNFRFYEVLWTVETIPPNAMMSWKDPSGALMQSNTPVTASFRSGRLSFNVELPGYAPIYTNFFFDPKDQQAQTVVLRMQRNTYPRPGRDFTNSLGMEFKWLEAVSAWASVMETRVADYRRFAASLPETSVMTNMFTLTANGWLQQGRSWDNPGFAQTEEHPVAGVNWQDAMDFCRWLTATERSNGFLLSTQICTLPTTNEWKRLAAKATFPWGEDHEPPKDANLAGKEATQPANSWPALWPVLKTHDDPWPRTAPVRGAGSRPVNFFHLGGNVSEWCAEGVLCGASWFDGEDGHLDCLQTGYLRGVGEDASRRDPRNGFRVIIHPNPDAPQRSP